MKKEIQTREDIEQMVDSFYEMVNKDELIGPFFNEIAQVDWPHHLPRMYDFWESILFDKTTFKGNPLQVHAQLNQKKKLEKIHFERWLSLFEKNLDQLFTGERAEKARQRAKSIAMVIELRINRS